MAPMNLWSEIMAIWSTKPGETPAERLGALERLCKVIERHISTYTEAGAALKEIRDRELYKATHRNFEDFCHQRWKMDRSHAYRLIAASEVALNLSPTGDTPESERLARPLTRLPAADQNDAWLHAKQLAGDDPVRPEHVAKAVSKRRLTKKKPDRAKPIRLRVPGGSIVIQPTRAFTTTAEVLRQALAQIESKRNAAA